MERRRNESLSASCTLPFINQSARYAPFGSSYITHLLTSSVVGEAASNG